MKSDEKVRAHSLREDLVCLFSPLDPEVLKEFIHRCADDLCGRKGPLGDKFCTACSWTEKQFDEAVRATKCLLTDCIIYNYSRSKIEEILPLNEGQINGLMSCIAVRADEIQKNLLNGALHGSSEVLHDYDWKLKLVMGSSSITSLQESLLELDLTTLKRPSEKSIALNDTIKIELTRENVGTVISALEKAQESHPRV